MTTTTTELTDIGPATSPPAWCLPDAVPLCDQTTEGPVWAWSREIGVQAWVEAEDRIIDGRVMRSAPRIHYSWPTAEGLTPEETREIIWALSAILELVEPLDGSQQ
jgi:hypothetical protein